MTQRPVPERVAVRNASDAQQVRAARKSERARLERERNEDVAVWSTYEGRALTRRILAECGVFRLSMANDPYWTAFNEGGRNVGLTLLARIQTVAPDAYVLMEQEHTQRLAAEPAAPEPPESEDRDDDRDDA